jgi:hypothetical protein
MSYNLKSLLVALGLKQDTLVSGTNIKTINGSSILGSGDLTVAGNDPTKLAILNNLSDLNNAATARVNIGLSTTANQTDSTNKRFITDAQQTVLSNTSGVNTGDQTSIVGITGTKAQFDTSCTDGNFLYVGDVVTSLKTKSGVVAGASFTGNPKKATVTFGAAFTDANYSVSVIGATPRTWSVESYVAGSFVINSNANTLPTGNVYWLAIKHGEN